MKRLCVILSILLAIPYAGWAASRITIYADPGGTDPLIDDVSGDVLLYVFAETDGATSVQFSAPIPNCFAGAAYVSDTHVFPATLGDSQNGVQIAFGGCLSGSVHVLTIKVSGQALTNTCCFYPAVPDPGSGSGEIEFIDCSSSLEIGSGFGAVVSARMLWVGEPTPTDGATGRPLDTKLDWNTNSCGTFIGLGVDFDKLYFGTDPNPPLIAEPFDVIARPFDPGVLQPGTTYYWRTVHTDTDDGTVESPVWSFSTMQAIPVEPMTWGRVKALFITRDL